MTLHLVVSSPSRTANYTAVLITEDRIYDRENDVLTDEWTEVNRVKVEPGHCAELYITDTRRMRIVEEHYDRPPTTPPPQPVPERLVTIDENAHGHD